MTKNHVCCTPCLSKHTSYYQVFCCASLKWWHLEMLFSFFLKKIIFWVVRWDGEKDKKWPKTTATICLTPYLRNCTSYDCGFWYTCVKAWYLQQFFFPFFQNSDFQVFQSSSINAKRKFWGLPHLLHICVIF